MEDETLSIIDLNVDTVLKIAWAGFMKIRELVYLVAKVKKTIFAETNLTRLDIFFVEGDEDVILWLK